MSQFPKMAYRADIDGLRAIAVLGVILFHVNHRWLPGGFVGVDIFFVISGFLITGILANEMACGTFSFARFYLRRVRRILPVFMTVLAATLIFGAVILLPQDFASLLASVRYTLLFVANFYFARERGYFDQAADELPLLHMWSLAVEEQFYFAWPVMLLAIWAIARGVRRAPALPSRASVLWATLALLVLGFVVSEFLVRRGTTQGYYSLASRFGELLVGAFTALAPRDVRRERRGVMEVMAGVGLGMIVAAYVVIDRHTPYPGWRALLPTVGAALVLHANVLSGAPTFVGRALGNVRWVRVGLLSYSLYLWHWPVLAFARYIWGEYELPLNWVLSVLVLTGLLSWLSYRYVEMPTRHRSMSFGRAFAVFYAAPGVLLMAACVITPKWLDTSAPAIELASYGEDVCHGTFDKQCIRGMREATPTVLVTGDSHAASLNAFIDAVGAHEGWAAQVLSASSCSPVFGYDENTLPDFARQPCAALKRYVQANYEKFDAIVLVSYWAFQLNMIDLKADPDYLEKLGNTLRTMARVRPVYVVSDVPRLPVSSFRLAHFEHLGLRLHRPSAAQTAAANAIVERLAKSIDNVHWVDLSPELAKFEQGGLYRDRPAYLDDQHLNIYGASALGQLWIANDKRLIVTFPHISSQ
ncbi:O-acetyltransferase OatA [Pandoraea eparura]|uniref:O-acetyltransferase OatA n=1 Tax=Pandoraea eparura TaxID=2508291 RepID=A0A5E4W911_9BURK|nr:acyltransferase family protein [Pandoraea eparura]VVE20359.1 O-acetyltransferase OatA [Pandoraea eparura]